MYFDDLLYHVYNRGAHKLPIFFSPENYLFCLHLLSKYKTKYNVLILAYCLMPNHYHLMLRQCLGGSIARFIQTTFNAYVQSTNVEQRHSGTLFEAKAKNKIIGEPAVIARYIHLNPVQAGLVVRPEHWQFSDYSEWAGLRLPTITNLELRNELFDSGEDYRSFVQEVAISPSEGLRPSEGLW